MARICFKSKAGNHVDIQSFFNILSKYRISLITWWALLPCDSEYILFHYLRLLFAPRYQSWAEFHIALFSCLCDFNSSPWLSL